MAEFIGIYVVGATLIVMIGGALSGRYGGTISDDGTVDTTLVVLWVAFLWPVMLIILPVWLGILAAVRLALIAESAGKRCREFRAWNAQNKNHKEF